MYFMGIDAGGSTCRARLTDEAGDILGRGVAGPANIRIGVPNVFAAIAQSYHQAIREAQLDDRAIASIDAAIGIAGIGRDGATAEMQGQAFPFHRTTLSSDGFVANIGAHSGRDGGSVIVGTGSIAVGRVAGRDIHIGGYGFPVSDEGSGAYIGLQAIRMTLRTADGRIAHSAMTRTLFQKFNDQPGDIIGWMDKATATDYATLAPLVIQAAEQGDEIGRGIIQRAAHHIELMVHGLYRSGVPRCALTGGLSQSIEPWLSPDIRARLKAPDGDPLDGALWLARQKAGRF